MKCRELFEIEHPGESVNGECPIGMGYIEIINGPYFCDIRNCPRCWDEEVTNTDKLAKIEKLADKMSRDYIVSPEDLHNILEHSNETGKTWAERIDENLAKANGTTVVNYPNLLRDTKKMVDHINDDMAENAEKIKQEYKELYESEKCIKDSGERREFETGAVRDIQEGKGRCELMPLDVVGKWLNSDILTAIQDFKTTGDVDFLYGVLTYFVVETSWDDQSMILQTAKHFEAGAVKYGENNWQKGIPVHCYIDSAVRHYLKFLRGDDDEPHDRAFVWNIMCCIWTCVHKPELNDFCEVKSDD